MVAYFSVLVATVVLARLADSLALAKRSVAADSVAQASTRRTVVDLAPAALLIAFLGTRFHVGTDYSLYETIYRDVNPAFWDYTLQESPQEVGYTVLQLLSKQAGLDFGAFLVVIAFLTVLPMTLGLSRAGLPLAYGLSFYVLLGPYLASFNILRQGLAMSLVFYAVTMLPSRAKFAIVATLAGIIHASSIPVIVVIYLLRNRNPSMVAAITSALIGVLLAGVYASSAVIVDLASALNPRYETYLVEDESGLGSYLIGAAHLAIVWVLVRHRDALKENHRAYITFAIAGIPFIVLGTQSVVLGRLELYFAMFLIPGLAATWSVLSQGIKLALCIAMTCYFAAYVASFGDLIPYQSTLFANS